MDVTDDIIKFSQVTTERPPSPSKSVRFKVDEKGGQSPKSQPAAGASPDKYALHNSFASVIKEFEGIQIKPREEEKKVEEAQPVPDEIWDKGINMHV
jgi:hypothetical protein